MDINQCAAIISGGASGLGEETAKQLAAKGAKIIILDYDDKKAKQVASAVNGLAFGCDVSQADQVESVFSEIGESLNVRICVNCAGVAPAARIVGKNGPMPLEEFSQVVSVNLVGTFNVMRLAAARMCDQAPINDDGERGVIINTASIAAFEGQIGQAAYSASKGGVAAMTLPAAREFGDFGVRVMTIAPGVLATPMMAAMPGRVSESLAKATPFPKRLGRAEEYARLVVHIIENNYLNGSMIRLDGALRMA